jgi:hypothetical protein
MVEPPDAPHKLGIRRPEFFVELPLHPFDSFLVPPSPIPVLHFFSPLYLGKEVQYFRYGEFPYFTGRDRKFFRQSLEKLSPYALESRYLFRNDFSHLLYLVEGGSEPYRLHFVTFIGKEEAAAFYVPDEFFHAQFL